MAICCLEVRWTKVEDLCCTPEFLLKCCFADWKIIFLCVVVIIRWISDRRFVDCWYLALYHVSCRLFYCEQESRGLLSDTGVLLGICFVCRFQVLYDLIIWSIILLRGNTLTLNSVPWLEITMVWLVLVATEHRSCNLIWFSSVLKSKVALVM